jgi:hypothetical protein
MRTLALAAAALLLAGCLGEGGTVTLTFDQQTGVSPNIGSGFNASNATANTSADGFIHFTATAGNTELTMLIVGPTLTAGQMVDMMADHNFVSIDVRNGSVDDGWGNNGGMIAVDGVNPYKLRFESIPMLVGGGQAQGTFVINGTGTFK